MADDLERDHQDREYLYVPEEERDEALSLGARVIMGDARMQRPRPMPTGVTAEAYRRWTTVEARYRWCMRLITRVLNDIRGRRMIDLREMLDSLGAAPEGRQRVYLWVCAQDAPAIRDVPGVRWDKRTRMYYATPESDLNPLFRFLTPTAQRSWEAERAMTRAVTALVQEQARLEVQRRTGTGGKSDDIGASGTSTNNIRKARGM